MHAVVFSPQVEAVREFFGDVLGLPSADAGGGWPIFGLPPAEVAVHPADEAGQCQLFLMCDDIHATIAELKDKGVEVGEVAERGAELGQAELAVDALLQLVVHVLGLLLGAAEDGHDAGHHEHGVGIAAGIEGVLLDAAVDGDGAVPALLRGVDEVGDA